jgi:hypothetical protein
MLAKEQPKKRLMVNHTGEAVQPCRLYYRIHNKKTVLGALKKLRCVTPFYKPIDGWQWLYDAEAKKLRFEIGFNKIPKEVRPIALGQFHLRGDDLVLDLRSHARALKAIQFFDSRINRRAASVYKLRLVNRFFSPDNPDDLELHHAPYDDFFADDSQVYIPDPEKVEADIQEIKKQYTDEAESLEAVSEYLEKDVDKPSPEIEEIPVHFYEDGLAMLTITLMSRYLEAQAKWAGKAEQFSKMNFIVYICGTLFDFDDEEEEEENAVEQLSPEPAAPVTPTTDNETVTTPAPETEESNSPDT